MDEVSGGILDRWMREASGHLGRAELALAAVQGALQPASAAQREATRLAAEVSESRELMRRVLRLVAAENPQVVLA